MRNNRLLTVLSLLGLVVAISAGGYYARKAGALDKRLDALEKLAPRVASLEAQTAQLGGQQLAKIVAVLSVAEKGFATIQTNNALFLVILDHVEPYANGHEITLRLGNPSAASYSDLKMKVAYGTGVGKYGWVGGLDDPVAGWLAGQKGQTLRQQEVGLTEVLLPGTWTAVKTVLAPATADEIGRIAVSVQAGTVSLQRLPAR